MFEPNWPAPGTPNDGGAALAFIKWVGTGLLNGVSALVPVIHDAVPELMMGWVIVCGLMMMFGGSKWLGRCAIGVFVAAAFRILF